jgi:hypothetical protein
MYFIKFYVISLVYVFSVLILLNFSFIQLIFLVFGNLICFINYFLN